VIASLKVKLSLGIAPVFYSSDDFKSSDEYRWISLFENIFFIPNGIFLVSLMLISECLIKNLVS